MNVPIYQQALGKDFTRLQPELQEYFSLLPGSGHYGVGEGVFDVAGCRQAWLRPLLKLTSGEEAFFPEFGAASRSGSKTTRTSIRSDAPASPRGARSVSRAAAEFSRTPPAWWNPTAARGWWTIWAGSGAWSPT